MALERQLQFMENRHTKMLETFEPDKANAYKKETRRALHKIQT